MQIAFLRWKHFNDFYSVLDENDKLKEYIHMLTRENETLSHERNILEL